MSRRSITLLLALVGLGGCAFFSALVGDPNSNNQSAGHDAQAEQARQAEEAKLAQQRADDELAAALTSARTAAQAEDATLEQVTAFVEQVALALQTGAIERGAISPDVVGEADAALDRSLAPIQASKDDASRTTRSLIHAARGYLRASAGRFDEAGTLYLAALHERATLELFQVLAGLPRSPSNDASTAQACPLVRDLIDGATLPDFIALCLEANGGDRSELAWKSAKKDLEAHDEEMARRAEQARLAELEAQRLAEEQAAAAARAEQWARAAVFASGTCRFSNCLKEGWEVSTSAGTIRTTCRFSNCLKDGWETSFPDGTSARTTCRFSDCMKDGWETSFPDGSSARTTCRFNNCPVDGWETSLPDGSNARTTCRFNNCFKDGWETAMPSGSVTCTCRFSDCLKDGSTCSG